MAPQWRPNSAYGIGACDTRGDRLIGDLRKHLDDDFNNSDGFNTEDANDSSVGDFDHHLNLDGRVEWERVGSDRGARMPTRLAEHLLHEFARTVGNLGLAIEAIIGLHENAQSHDAPNLRKIATELVGNHRQRVQCTLLRSLLRIFDRDLRRHWSGGKKGSARHGQLARHHDQVSSPNRWHVGSNGLGGGGKGDTEALKRGVWIGHRGSPRRDPSYCTLPGAAARTGSRSNRIEFERLVPPVIGHPVEPVELTETRPTNCPLYFCSEFSLHRNLTHTAHVLLCACYLTVAAISRSSHLLPAPLHTVLIVFLVGPPTLPPQPPTI